MIEPKSNTIVSSVGLFEQLKKEKKKLAEAKIILDKKDNHIYPISNIPFIIPSHWIWCYLSDISLIQEGPGIRKHQYATSGVQFLTVTNILEGSVDLEKSKKYISHEQYKNYSHFTINKGDIVTACSGGSWGKSAIYDFDDKLILNTSTLRLRFYNDLGNNSYLYYLTKTNYFKDILSSYITGQQPNYGYSHYSKIPIPLPPLTEQNRIVAIIEEAFFSINMAKANAEQNLKNAKELFESYLQGVFENKGEDWEEDRLEDLCDLISKGSSPKWQGINYVDEPGVLFVTSENVGENTLLLRERKYVEEKFNIKDSKSILRNGDVLTNIVGASIGRTAIYNLDEIANINQAVCLIRCKNKVLHNEYLMYLLNSPFTKQHLHENEVNNARANLSLGFFRNLTIPYPKIEIQQEIVHKIKIFHFEAERLSAVYQQKIANIEELKKTILQRAFNGELKTLQPA